MLRLLATRRGNEMHVRKPVVWTWLPFNLILSLLIYQGALWVVHLFNRITAEDIDGRLPLSRGAALMAGIFALELLLILLGMLLWKGLVNRRYILRADGIEVVRLIMRMPVRRRFYDQPWIYSFRFVENADERNIRGKLRFKADGDDYPLATGVERWEAERFVEKLRAEGFAYSAAEEPETRSKTSAHTLLG